VDIIVLVLKEPRFVGAVIRHVVGQRVNNYIGMIVKPKYPFPTAN